MQYTQVPSSCTIGTPFPLDGGQPKNAAEDKKKRATNNPHQGAHISKENGFNVNRSLRVQLSKELVVRMRCVFRERCNLCQ